jgi:hypothetical protein
MPERIIAQDVEINGQIVLTENDQVLAAAGAVDPNCAVTVIDSAGAIALTLAPPIGNKRCIKYIYMRTDGGNATLTPTASTTLGFTTAVFGDVGDSLTLFYNGAVWVVLGGFGVTPS